VENIPLSKKLECPTLVQITFVVLSVSTEPGIFGRKKEKTCAVFDQNSAWSIELWLTEKNYSGNGSPKKARCVA
jgi:hypothetical protein